MAKKKENQLTYLQMPLPQGRKSYRMAKRSWSGLNYRQTIDTGALSVEHNISTLEAPYLVPSQRHTTALAGYRTSSKRPIGIFGFDDFLLVIYKKRGVSYTDGGATGIRDEIWAEYITYDSTHAAYHGYDGFVGVDEETSKMTDAEYAKHVEQPRCVVQFNTYLQSDDIINGEYKKNLLIFPDKKSMFFELDDLLNDQNNTTGNDFKLYDLDVTIKEYYNDQPRKDKDGNVITPREYPPPENADKDCYYRNTYKCDETIQGKAIFKYCQYDTVYESGENKGKKDGGTANGWKIVVPPNFPNIKYASVHLSRLFGVSEDSVFASGFNDFTNWNTDSIDTYNESNAWCSKTQSNTKADGNFTGIINFQGHIVCFKRDFMHEIYNTKNPFRIQDIFAEGAIDHRTIQDVDGRLIFVSSDGVKLYTGSNPRNIGHNLNVSEYTHAVSGTDGRCYYLYCEDADKNNRLFTYDTIAEHWSEQSVADEVLSFAHNKNGTYMLCADGYVYKLNTGLYNHEWWFETDLITNETVNIKHIKKMQMFADIGEDAWLNVYFLYDDEEFDTLSTTEKENRLVYMSRGIGRKTIRVKPRKTANYGVKLHVEGGGYVRLYELELFMESGGDLYV